MTPTPTDEAIYELLKGLQPHHRKAALAYAKLRIGADERRAAADKNAGPTPTFWTLGDAEPGDDISGHFIADVLREADAEPGDVVELCGWAVVYQSFLVAVASDEIGVEFQEKPTRAEADAYAKAYLDLPARDEADREPEA